MHTRTTVFGRVCAANMPDVQQGALLHCIYHCNSKWPGHQLVSKTYGGKCGDHTIVHVAVANRQYNGPPKSLTAGVGPIPSRLRAYMVIIKM